MSGEKKYKAYTAADIEKYHKGLLSAREMHALEKAALDDPFLADALEGYGGTSVNVAADLSELEKKLNERVAGDDIARMPLARKSFQWWKVAAAIIIVGGVGFFTYRIATKDSSREVAAVESKKNSNQQTSGVAADTNKLSTETSSTAVVPPANESADSGKDESTASVTRRITNRSSDEVNRGSVSEGNAVATAGVAASDLDKKVRYDTLGQANGISEANALAKAPAKSMEGNQRQPSAVMQQKESGVIEQQAMNYFRGRVMDADNNPVPFANISNAKDNVGTYTDARGEFTLISPDSMLDVRVRSIGFENNLTRLKNNVSSNQIVMREEKVAPDRVLSYSKRDTSSRLKRFVKLEEPEPADGWSNYEVYLANNLNIPDNLEKGESNRGQVSVSFEVNQNGDPVNIQVEKSLCQKCDDEAIRVVKQGPKWKKKNNKNRRVTINIPFQKNR